ncbi:MAG TPA: hypothetical protein PK646_00435 [Bacillota bacterium]|jgi:uncharacterized lipoprotein|nr:hypothetical protein [Fastidiosipila sp.]HPX93577.1 hypothetical protein [Bacillota bacterium]HQB80552.1 hypothetical protein [Bacillota bacterium]
MKRILISLFLLFLSLTLLAACQNASPFMEKTADPRETYTETTAASEHLSPATSLAEETKCAQTVPATASDMTADAATTEETRIPQTTHKESGSRTTRVTTAGCAVPETPRPSSQRESLPDHEPEQPGWEFK